MVELARAEAAGQPSPRNDPTWTVRARLVETLYQTRTGAAVRRQIVLWNASRGLLAVRDDRPRPAAEAANLPGPILPGDRPNRWSATNADDRPVNPVDLFVPESFRFVSGAPRPGFSDWGAYTVAGPGLRLKTVMELDSPTTVTLQVIGRVDADRSELPKGATVIPRCPKTPCDATTAPGAEIVLPSLASGRHTVTLSVLPVAHDTLPVPDLALVPSSPLGGRPVWKGHTHRPGRPQAPEREALTLLSADGAPLWHEDRGAGIQGRPTPEAIAAGVLPLIGFGADDRQGVAGILTHRADNAASATVNLTIDLRTQAAAQEVLDAVLGNLFAPDDPYRDQRRAAIVLLDLNGAIIASAGHPFTPAGLHAWDYAARRATDRRRDPLVVQAWQGREALHTLGSTGKTITSTAGLLAARDDALLAAMLAGCARRGDLLPCAWLEVGAGSYRMPGQQAPIYNFRRVNGHHETIADGLAKPRRDRACALDAVARSETYGLREAIRDSLNMWFIRLAEVLDRAAAAEYDAAAVCESAWNKDPVEGVIGICQTTSGTGPLAT